MCRGLSDGCIENHRLKKTESEIKAMENYVNNVLSPLIQGDGGYIEYIEENGDTIRVLARGECSKCGKLDLCMSWCEEKAFRDLGRKVKFTATRKKPFFWDK